MEEKALVPNMYYGKPSTPKRSSLKLFQRRARNMHY